MSDSGKFLRRYTDLTSLFYLLSTQTLTLLDPQKWEDKNDSFYLDLYKKKRSSSNHSLHYASRRLPRDTTYGRYSAPARAEFGSVLGAKTL